MIRAVRGTRDLYPPDTALWNFVEAAVRDVFRAYNFHEIRTPIFEETSLFARGVGEETDIVSKEMYTWFDGDQPKEQLLRAWWVRNRALRKQGQGCDPNQVEFGRQLGTDSADIYIEGATPNIIVFAMQDDASARAVLRSLESGWKSMPAARAAPNVEPKLTLLIPDRQRSKTGDPRISTLPDGIELIEIPIAGDLRPLTLRPENTAGVVRAYIEHKLGDRGLQKLYYIGPQFRRERPQKGRYRQFYQIGAEVIGPPATGSESPARDAEVLEMLATLLDELGLRGWTLQLNSVGCAADRARYNQALRDALKPVIHQMCADCQRRAFTNPLRVFDCKVPEDQPIIEKLPRMSQFLDEDCRRHFTAVQEILTATGVPFVLNDRLVRGLDYYTKTAFEFTHGSLGAQNAILGGGRYDGLSEALGGPPAPGIGFAIGEDRVVLSLKESAESLVRKPDVYVAPLGAGMNREAAKLARELRRHDLVVELGEEGFRLKKSFEAADRVGARYILIVGENEVKADGFALKNLTSGEQVSVPRAELAQKIQTH